MKLFDIIVTSSVQAKNLLHKVQRLSFKKRYYFIHFNLQLVDTSIYLPPSLFQQIPSDVNVKFQFIVYSNSKLFPEITNGSETEKKREVSSSVMSAQFGE